MAYSILSLRWEAFGVVICHRPDLANVPGTVELSVTGKNILGCSSVAVVIESCRLLYWTVFFVNVIAELRV